MKMRAASLMTALLLSSGMLAQGAFAAVHARPVMLAANAAAKQITGHIRGDETMDYLLHAQAGQMLAISMKGTNAASYFNLLKPGSDEALANGSMLGNKWSGALPEEGDYRVRVYLMRSAARRNEASTYTLSLALQASAAAPHDAKVAGTPYHATGHVPCSVGPDPKGSAQCPFGVIRQGGERAEVHLAQPGQALSADPIVLQFDGSRVAARNMKLRIFGRHHGDEWEINVNDFNFFTVPDAVINGG